MVVVKMKYSPKSMQTQCSGVSSHSKVTTLKRFRPERVKVRPKGQSKQFGFSISSIEQFLYY